VLCAALALNALALPYAGFLHDAQLYAAQVLERLQPGRFRDDLFLLYGSQDRYSLFTPLAVPVVRLLGLRPAFLVLYLASKLLFFWGALRLTGAVVRDRAATLLAMLFLALAPLPWGGNQVFHLNESFLTPRVAACGLVMLGLERMLAGRLKTSLLALGGSFLLHPLMAAGGLLIFLAWKLPQHLTTRQLAVAAVALCLVAAAVVGYEPLGGRAFGRMDEEWRDVYLGLCFFIRPEVWTAGDWARVVWSFLVVGAGVAWFARDAARFLLAVLCAALAGLVGSLIAVGSHYLLLLQVSPYRAMWVLEFLAAPLGFLGVVRLWRRGTGPGRAAGLGLLLVVAGDWNELTLGCLGLFLALTEACAIGYRGLGKQPRQPDWLGPSGSAAFVALAGLLAAGTAWWLAVMLSAPTPPHLDAHPLVFFWFAPQVLPKLPLLLLACFALALGVGLLGPRWQYRAALLGLWLGYQTALTAVSWSPGYQQRYSEDWKRARLIATHLETDPHPGRPAPTVYWPTELRNVWFGVGAHSYFNRAQMAGSGFNRGTALEGKRRARLVERFESNYVRTSPSIAADWRPFFLRFYHATEGDQPPTRGDLLELCREEVLDLVVVGQRFDGLYSATDGRYYLYDCRRLRSGVRPAAGEPRSLHPQAGPG
jgi:hypothetical protein